MITINRNKEDLKRQFRYIDLLVYQRFYRRKLIVFSLMALVVLTSVFWILGDNYNVVVLKAISFVFTMFTWLVFLPYILWFVWKRRKAKTWVSNTIKNSLENQDIPMMDFDENKIVFQGRQYKSEYSWSVFSSYKEELDTLYLFQNGRSYYECTSFSSNEIGIGNLEKMKTIVKAKLKPLLEKFPAKTMDC